MRKTSVILLAGGTGKRMSASLPKQYLPLKDKPIVRYSLDLFLSMPCFDEYIIVCDPLYQIYFQDQNVKFALPGNRRQDSVFNGLQKVHPDSEYVCIHDSARPFISKEVVENVLQAAFEHQAAVAAVPVKYTIKQGNFNQFVSQTLERSALWEIQTPQIIQKELLHQGFQLAHEDNLTVTDDVSLVELLKKPVKLVEGCYSNFKITTQEDMAVAKYWLQTSI